MKSVKVLATAALVCALFLTIVLTAVGVDKFHYVLAGGKKFATFANQRDQLAIGLSYLFLQGLYLLWLFTSRPKTADTHFGKRLRLAAIFLVLAFLAYPLGDDIYLYLHTGLMDLSAINPFVTRAKAVTTALSPFVDWGQTSTYGPISQLLFAGAAMLVPLHPILTIYAFKAVCLGLHVLNGYLIWRLLATPDRGKITSAYLLNPLLLMEQVGSGHVDILVSTSAILTIGSLTAQRYVPATIALWGGFLAKTLPIIWMPLVGIFVLRQRRWQQLTGMILVSMAILVALWCTVLHGLPAWQSLLNPGVTGQYQSSILALLRSWLNLVRIFVPSSMTLAQENNLLLELNKFMLLGFVAFYAGLAWQGFTKRHYQELNLIEDLGWATLTLFLLATPWLMPWYASVLFAIAALIPQAQLFALTSLVFGFASSAQYLLQGHNSLKSIVMIGLPLLVLILGTKVYRLRSVNVSPRATV